MVAVADFKDLTDNRWTRTLDNVRNLQSASDTQLTSIDAKITALEAKIEGVFSLLIESSFAEENVEDSPHDAPTIESRISQKSMNEL